MSHPASAAWHRLLLLVHTLVRGGLMVMPKPYCHEVSMIFPGPPLGTGGGGWVHELSCAAGHIALYTLHIQ